MNAKYEMLLDDCIEVAGQKLYRIRALRSFGDIKRGDTGGYITSEANLSVEGEAWVYGGENTLKNVLTLF